MPQRFAGTPKPWPLPCTVCRHCPLKTSIKPGIKTGVAIDRALREHFRKQAAECLIQPHHPPVNVLGGYRFAGAPSIDLSPIATAPAPAATAVVGDGLDIPDDLSIPDFLRRR
jgi:hypothetical protein